MASVRKKKQPDPIDEARKRDALALAQLLLDMYKESKMKGVAKHSSKAGSNPGPSYSLLLV